MLKTKNQTNTLYPPIDKQTNKLTFNYWPSKQTNEQKTNLSNNEQTNKHLRNFFD